MLLRICPSHEQDQEENLWLQHCQRTGLPNTQTSYTKQVCRLWSDKVRQAALSILQEEEMERLQHAAVAAREAARASREQLGCARADAAAAKEGAKRAEAAHQQALARLAESKCADSQHFESTSKPVMVHLSTSILSCPCTVCCAVLHHSRYVDEALAVPSTCGRAPAIFQCIDWIRHQDTHKFAAAGRSRRRSVLLRGQRSSLRPKPRNTPQRYGGRWSSWPQRASAATPPRCSCKPASRCATRCSHANAERGTRCCRRRRLMSPCAASLQSCRGSKSSIG